MYTIMQSFSLALFFLFVLFHLYPPVTRKATVALYVVDEPAPA